MTRTAAHEKVSVYFNLDNGSGAIRGVYLQGNEAVRPIFNAWIDPLRSMGMTTLTIRGTGATDHVSFDEIDLPGFQFTQDPLEYSTHSHHTNMDLYERVQLDDLMKNAVILAIQKPLLIIERLKLYFLSLTAKLQIRREDGRSRIASGSVY